MKRQAGFTLVEIAIVLVVIGLLLGGVLKGQELILNSQIRSAINEYNNVASAMFTYQDRYRQIPGDDNTAFTRWPPVGAAGIGNRNGVIEGTNLYVTGQPSAATAETGLFWLHLRNDGIIVGPTPLATGVVLPRNAFDGTIGVQDTVFTVATGIIGPVICQSNVQFQPATIIDTRIDDAVGSTGSLQAAAQANASTEPNLGVVAVVYANGSRHTLCRQL